MRAWRSDSQARIAPSLAGSRLIRRIVLFSFLIASWLGAAAGVARAADPADTIRTDDGGFNVRVIEEKTLAKVKAKVAAIKAREAAEKAAGIPKPPQPPDTPDSLDVPDVPEPPDFDRSDANALVRFGEDVTIPADKVIEGDVVAIGGDITVLGRVRGDAVSVGGAVSVKGNGVIEGDAVSLGGGVRTEDSASVGGSNVSVGTWNLGHGAHFVPALGIIGALSFGTWVLTTLARILLTLFFAWIALMLLRDRMLVATRKVGEQFGASFLWGLLMWAALILIVPVGIVAMILVDAIAVVILCITIIGIPVALLLVVALVLAIVALVVAVVFAMFLGYVNGAMYLGRRVLAGRVQGEPKPMLALLIGLLLVALIALAGKLIGFIGIFVFHPLSIAFAIAAGALSFILTTAGLGAMWVSRFRGDGSPSWGGRAPNWGPAPSATGGGASAGTPTGEGGPSVPASEPPPPPVA